MTKEIYMTGPSITELEEQYVMDALRNGWRGEKKYYYCEKLEEEFAKVHNRRYALMTPNCTSAIHLILTAIGVKPGDEIIVPDCTWIATVAPAVHLGAKLIFADIDPDTWCLSAETVEPCIGPKTKAIISVDLYGSMPDYGALSDLAKKNGLFLLEDAAESLFSTTHIREVRGGIPYSKSSFAGDPLLAAAAVFSFHNTKTMVTGEGGMLILDDQYLYEKCVKLRDHGRGPTTPAYMNDMVGYKYMPFNLQAALGLAQFERAHDLTFHKVWQASRYKEELSSLGFQWNPSPFGGGTNSCWMPTAILPRDKGIDKHQLIEALAECGIPARPFFYPLSSIPAFRQAHIYSSINKNAYSLSPWGVSFPGDHELGEHDISNICDHILEIFE
jgi:perosamine synthetase